MELMRIEGVAIEGMCAAIPERKIKNDPKIAQATGIVSRRIAEPGTTVVDLCVAAAERVMSATGSVPSDFGAVVFVSFTQHHRMPSAAAQAQTRLGLPNGVIAFDVSLACSGWGYGLYLAGLLARETHRKVLLLDGDVQSEFLDHGDRDTASLLSDGGTATIVAPNVSAEPWSFAFWTDGSQGRVLELAHGGTIKMDGFGVFKFVATDVVRNLREFIAATGEFDMFVPHQANAYVVRQLAKSAGVAETKTVIACDTLGNMASASVPVAIVSKAVRGKILFAGFGGGLSIAMASIFMPPSAFVHAISIPNGSV